MVKRYNYLVSALIILFSPVMVFAAEGEDQGFWASMLWGTEVDPGVLRSVWNWTLSVIYAAVDPLLQMFYNALPNELTQQDFSSLKVYFNVANDWLPLDYAFTLLAAYYVFVGVFSSAKIIIKLIPGIG